MIRLEQLDAFLRAMDDPEGNRPDTTATGRLRSMSGYEGYWSGSDEPGLCGQDIDGVQLRPGSDGEVTAWIDVRRQDGTQSGTEFALSTNDGLTGKAWRVENGVRVAELPCIVEPGEADDTYWIRLGDTDAK